MGINIFLAELSNVSEKDQIMRNGPWTFYNNLVAMVDYDCSLQLSKTPLLFASF